MAFAAGTLRPAQSNATGAIHRWDWSVRVPNLTKALAPIFTPGRLGGRLLSCPEDAIEAIIEALESAPGPFL